MRKHILEGNLSNQTLQSEYSFTTSELIKDGHSSQTGSRSFIANPAKGLQGNSEVDHLPEFIQEDHSAKEMRQGALWLLAGIIATLAAYAFTGMDGTFLITYAVITYGVVLFLKGFARL